MPYKRSRKLTYNKKFIDILFYQLDATSEVLVQQLIEDRANNKLSSIKNEENATKDDGNKRSTNVKNCKDDEASEKNTNEPTSKKQKLDTDGRDALKLVLYKGSGTNKFKSQIKSLLKPNNDIASTSTNHVPMIIDCEESAESVNSPAQNENQSIFIIDVKEMMDEHNYRRWMEMISSDENSNDQTNGLKKLVVAKRPINRPEVKEATLPLNTKNHERKLLIKIENFYKKYFSKCEQETVVIIANILNIISISNQHHKLRMDESFNKKTEAEKLKARCEANLVHERHTIIVEKFLMFNFLKVVTKFDKHDFEFGFKIFFLTIVGVLQILDRSNLKKCGIFNNLKFLLYHSLKNTGYNDSRVFSIFRSKAFERESFEIMTLVEDIPNIDPEVIHRMPLFFIKTLSTLKYFQTVIDVVTNSLNGDLGLLIDNAINLYRFNSEFKDPVDSLTVQHSNAIIPMTANSHNFDGVKNPDVTNQQIPTLNDNTFQFTGNTAVEPSIVTSQPLNNFYQSSSPQQQQTYEPSTSKVNTENKCFVVAPTISHCPLVKVTAALSGTKTSIPTTTNVPINSSVQCKKSVANSPLLTNEGDTVLLDNKPHQLVGSLLSDQMRVVDNDINNTSVKPPQTEVIKCFVKNCNYPSSVMCSQCRTTKYCSKACQEQDWFGGHVNDCERMQSNKNHP